MMRKAPKYGIFATLAIIVIILSLSSIVINYIIQKNSMYDNEIKKLANYNDHFEENIEIESKMLHSFIDLIKGQGRIQKEFLEGNREGLNDIVKDIYESLNQNNDITHLYFIDKNGKVFLRAHDCKMYSDTIDRYTFKRAQETQKPFHGIEFGIKKNYTLRVVHPWIVNDELIGYIEVGKEIDKVISDVALEFNMEIYIGVEKSNYADAPKDIKEVLENMHSAGDYYIVYSTNKIPKNIAKLISIEHDKGEWIDIDGENFMTFTTSLIDVSKEHLGDIVYLVNIEDDYKNLISEVKKDIMFMSFGTLFLLFIGYMFARTKQARIDMLMNNLHSEIEKQTFAIKQQKIAFETLFEKAPYGILIIVDGKFQQCNEKVVEILGYKSKGEFLSSTPANLSPEYQPDGQTSLEKSKKMNAIAYENGVNQFEWVHTRANGENFWCEVVLTPIFLPEVGEVLHVLWRDISKQKDSELALQREREGLKEALAKLEKTNIELDKAIKESDAAAKTKSEFLANMSHEIRTPMNAILGMSYLALKGKLGPEERNYIEKVHRSADMLLGILNDILDFSKIDADQLVIEKIDFSLLSVLEDLVSIIELKVQAKDIEFIYWLDENSTTEFIGDPLRLGQVLLNLVGNAIKFTENNGEIFLNINVDEDYRDEALLHFSIKDNGIGMSSENIDKLFKAFSQADTSTTRKYGGTGLGLMISKKLVELMGGKIWVESEQGKGSTFHFTALLKKQENSSKKQARKFDSILEKVNILLVDDSDMSRVVISKILKRLGLFVQEATNGKSAIELLEKKEFDLIITDWKMDEMDGIEMIRNIQNDQAIKKQPKVIMVTAHGFEEAMSEARDLSIKQFISKPVSFSKIHDAIIDATEHISGAYSKKLMSEHEDSIVTSKLRGAHLLLVEDNEINRELATDLLNSAGISVGLASNGKEAIEKLNDERFDGILMDCHMPVMDGYEAAKKIREDEKYKDIPIIALTANVLSDDRIRALESGMNDQISKPIRPADMFETISKWITTSSRTDFSKTDENLDDSVEIPHIDGIDIDKGLIVTQNNKALYLNLLKKFAAGQKWFKRDFKSAFDSGEQEESVRLAHTLKGLAGNVGATNLQEAAAKLERLSKDNSNHRDIEKALSDVVNILEPLINELEKLQDNRTTVKNSDESLDIDDLLRLLSEIKILAKDDDTEALEYCNRFKNLKQTQRFGKKIDLLVKHLESYAFEEAIDVIEILEDEIGKLS